MCYRFEKLLREEKEAEVQAQVKARESKQEAELARLKSEELKQFQSQFNEDPPNLSDKIVSLIPYIFPLLDSIQYGRYLISTEQDNPLIVILIVLYKLYEVRVLKSTSCVLSETYCCKMLHPICRKYRFLV